jgi:hypothetical protein
MPFIEGGFHTMSIEAEEKAFATRTDAKR